MKLVEFFRTPRGRVIGLIVLGVIGSVLFVGIGLMGSGNGRGRASAPGKPNEGGFEVSARDSQRIVGFVESYQQRIQDTERDRSRAAAQVEDLSTQLENQRVAMETLRKELEDLRTQEISRATRGSETPPDNSNAPPPSSAYLPPHLGNPQEERLQTPEKPLPRLEKLTMPGGDLKEELEAGNVVLPAGSFAEGRLLTGAYAPTNDSAQPVLLKIDSAFTGPNRSRIPIQGAFLVGKAIGDPNSVRAIIQFHKLSYVRKNGKPIEVPVNGFVAGEAGTQGLAGTYHWRIEEAAGLAALTGGISAAADAAAAQETTALVNPLGGVSEAVTGDVGKFALARGVSRATDEVGRIITRRLDEIIPAVYVENGRALTVVLIDGITLEGLPVDELENSTSRSPYAGLDLDR